MPTSPAPIIKLTQENSTTALVQVVIPPTGDQDVSLTNILGKSDLLRGRTPVEISVKGIYYTPCNFQINLFWEADNNIQFWCSGAGNLTESLSNVLQGNGYIQNDAGRGKTGSILLSTTNLTNFNGATLFLVIHKKFV